MKSIYQYLFVLCGLLSSTVILAQPPAPPATPIDGGLTFLLAAGGVYGVKKLRDIRKNK